MPQDLKYTFDPHVSTFDSEAGALCVERRSRRGTRLATWNHEVRQIIDIESTFKSSYKEALNTDFPAHLTRAPCAAALIAA